MSDLFHEQVPDAYIDQVFDVIQRASQHTFQILTKRAERLAEYFSTRETPTNAWLGVSVEDKAYGVPRIDCLRKIDATIRFLSAEPLLEDFGEIDLTDIHWVIVGGESGSKARPMQQEWGVKHCGADQHRCVLRGARGVRHNRQPAGPGGCGVV